MLRQFFYPASLCIPGASTKEKSIGYELLKTIKSFGYTGKVFPVNPNAKEILGYQCYASIMDIKETIDLAVIVVPKKFVFDTITALINKKVQAIILITAGFKETGEEGAKIEAELVELIRSGGARMVGPNCMGIINSFHEIKLNATFVAEHPKESRAAFLSQSGGLGAAVLNTLRDTDTSFGHFVSVGNKGDINENDLLEYWYQTADISVIAMYLESFVNGEKFIQLVQENNSSKPVILVKAGKSEAGMKAASSHTGALGGSDRAVNAIAKQFGIIRAETINEMFSTVKGYEHHPLPRGKNIAVISNAGGPAILCVDSIEQNGLQLAKFSDETKEQLRAIVHPEGSVQNPVDLLPLGSASHFTEAINVMLADPAVDAVISLFVEPVMMEPLAIVKAVDEIVSDKPIYQAVMPLPEFWQRYAALPNPKPKFKQAEEPARVIANLLHYHQSIQHKATRLVKSDDAVPLNVHNGWLSEQHINALTKTYAIPVVESKLFGPEELKAIKSNLNFPLTLKGIVKGVVHKSEMQLVELNIRDGNELELKAAAMSRRIAETGYKMEAFLIQPFLQTRLELLVGGYRDPSFGPMVMFGTGGKYVEVWNDTSLRSAYLTEADIDEMINEVAVGKILKGVRGEAPIDIDKIKKVIRGVAQIMIDQTGIMEIDCNPLIITKAGETVCVDIRVRTK